MSEIIGDEPCPRCRSSGGDKTGNHLILFDNGNKFCNRCGYKEINNKEGGEETLNKLTVEDILELPFAALPDRGLSKEDCERFGIRVAMSPKNREITHHYYPIHKKGEIVGFKERTLPKQFRSIGDGVSADLFGQQLYGEGSQLLIITEGELDAVSVYKMLKKDGKLYRVVSVSNGASTKSIENNLEWIDSYKSVIVCGDQDDVGNEFADKISDLLPPGKVKVMKFSEKDANDLLLKGKDKEFIASLFNARIKRPDGIVSGKDTWDIITKKERIQSIPYPDDWNELNQKTYGVRAGELDTWTSGSGAGKSQIFKELQFHLLNKTKDNIGIISLEESLTFSVESLMSLFMNKRLHLPDVIKHVTDKEYREAWKATHGDNRLHYYDHFGSVDDDSLISKIRFLAKGLGCKYIFLDHLSIVVSEFAQDGGEREKIDSIMTRLKKLTQELNIWIGLVVHLRKTTVGGKTFEQGAIPNLDDLRGSGSIKQLSNSVYATSRNQQADDEVVRNTSLITALKCRFTGRTGGADKLKFDDTTGRMTKFEDVFEEDEGEERF